MTGYWPHWRREGYMTGCWPRWRRGGYDGVVPTLVVPKNNESGYVGPCSRFKPVRGGRQYWIMIGLAVGRVGFECRLESRSSHVAPKWALVALRPAGAARARAHVLVQ